MANIKTTVDAMPAGRILPEQTEKPSPSEVEVPDPTTAQIEAAVDLLADPNRYGRHYPRLARQVGITDAQFAKVAEAYHARRAVEAAKQPAEVAVPREL